MYAMFLLLAAVPIPQFADRVPTPRFAEVPVIAEVRELTDAEKDAKYLRENHWRLSAGSCGMLGCRVHGGGWLWEKVKQVDETLPFQAPSGPKLQDRNGLSASTTGHWEYQQVGLFGLRTRLVWVADTEPSPAPAGPERREPPAPPVTTDASDGPGAGCKTGGG